MNQTNVTIDATPESDGVPDTDVLLRRAAHAARGLVDAREAHAGGTTALVSAYEELADDHRALVSELATRDDELARCEAQLASKDVEAASLAVRLDSVTQDAERFADESRRLGDIAREALSQVRAVRADRDELATSFDALTSEHRRLSLAFQELISKVGQDARSLSDEGRRITGIVPPGPGRTRPAPLRAPVSIPEAPAALPAPRQESARQEQVQHQPLAALRQVPPSASKAVSAPSQAPFAPALTGDVEKDILNVVSLSIASRAREVHVEEPVGVDELEDMASALGSFGSLGRLKTA